MSVPVPESRPFDAGQLALGARLGLIAIALTLETLLLSFLIQQTPVASAAGLAAVVHDVQHWLFRFLIAYAVACVILFSLGRRGSLASIGASDRDAPIRPLWLAVHALSLIPFALLSALLYSDATRIPFLVRAVGWHLNAAAALLSLFAALAPLPTWARAFGRSRRVLLFAIAPALGTVLAVQWSQSLWRPAAGLTFWLTTGLLHPFLPNLSVDVPTLTLGTSRFAVQIADVCSGLEGVGLMLVFCVSWLWFFRREYYFPRALLVIPSAMILIFLLNTVRIAAHARYLGLHGLVRKEATDRGLTSAQANDLMRRCEAITAAIAIHHDPHLVVLPEAHGQSRVKPRLNADGSLDIAKVSAKGAYSESATGFYGTYRGPEVDLGVIAPGVRQEPGERYDDKAVRPALEQILELAAKERVTANKLKASGHLCPCAAQKKEAMWLREIVGGTAGGDNFVIADEARHDTVRLIARHPGRSRTPRPVSLR